MIHANSIASWRSMDPGTRNHEICETLARCKRPVTDREITEELGSQDMNYARPAITKLVQEGWIKEVGTKRCKVTDRLVRVIRLATDEERRQFIPPPDLAQKRFDRLQEIVAADSLRWKKLLAADYRGPKPLGYELAEEAMAHRSQVLQDIIK